MEANLQAQSLIRGKRSKRHRPLSPISTAVPNSSTTTTNHSLQSPATETRCRTEEEDMAHCLILLAQGPTQKPKLELPVSRFGDFKVVGGEGLFTYRCRTCDRCFPCFQALGGHRASHKISSKTEQNRALKPNRTATTATALTLRTPNRVEDSIKSKVHECVVCGAEFASGQALGGHMRRHRAIPVPTKTTTSSSSTSLDTDGDVFNPKQRSSQMELDLNLPPPAPEDYRRVVDCFHY